jgi:nucleotide-binding universal stress UspA family protein
MKTILVPVDFSPSSDSACKYAIALAKEFKAKLILMHAFESTVLYSKIPLTTVQLDYSYLFNNAASKLKKYYKKLIKITGKIEVELNVQTGLPSTRIAELALDKKADLIVMGSTGKGSIDLALIGSNTSRTIRNAPCLVMVIPPKAVYKGLGKIVYATDMTSDNLKHAKRLLPICKNLKSELIFLNVSNSNAKPTLSDFKKINTKINNIVDYSKTSEFIANDSDIVKGVEYFLKYNKADCLSVYTHHKNIIERIFNPSISKMLSLHTSIPLIVIHKHDFDASSFSMKN